MNATGKQLIAFWLHRKGEHWTLQSVDQQSTPEVLLNCKQTAEVWTIFVLIFQEVSSCMQKCSLYHYITTNGKYKSAVIIQLNKEIGSDLSKVLLIFQVSKCHFFAIYGII